MADKTHGAGKGDDVPAAEPLSPLYQSGAGPSGAGPSGAGPSGAGQSGAGPSSSGPSSSGPSSSGPSSSGQSPRGESRRGARERPEDAWERDDEESWGADEAEQREGLTRGIRKALASGIRSVLHADDAIQRGVPREVVGYIMRQTDSAKDEIVRVAGVQIRRFLENIDIGRELQKILTSVSFEIRTEVRFIPNDKSVSPRAKMKVRVKDNETGRVVTADPAGAADAVEEVVGDGLRGAWRRRVGSAVDRAMNAFQRELGIDELDPEDASGADDPDGQRP